MRQVLKLLTLQSRSAYEWFQWNERRLQGTCSSKRVNEVLVRKVHDQCDLGVANVISQSVSDDNVRQYVTSRSQLKLRKQYLQNGNGSRV